LYIRSGIESSTFIFCGKYTVNRTSITINFSHSVCEILLFIIIKRDADGALRERREFGTRDSNVILMISKNIFRES
jgi:hypothetical protein